MSIVDTMRLWSPVQTSMVRLACHHHQRLLHDGAERALACGLGGDLATRDGQSPSRSDDFRLSDQALSGSRRQEIELVFDGEHARAGRKEGKPRVPASRIGDSTYDACMDVAVLLREVVTKRQLDRAEPGPEVGNACADKAHRFLPIKTRFHSCGVPGIGRNEVRPHAGCGLRHHRLGPRGRMASDSILIYVYVNVN